MTQTMDTAAGTALGGGGAQLLRTKELILLTGYSGGGPQ